MSQGKGLSQGKGGVAAARRGRTFWMVRGCGSKVRVCCKARVCRKARGCKGVAARRGRTWMFSSRSIDCSAFLTWCTRRCVMGPSSELAEGTA